MSLKLFEKLDLSTNLNLKRKHDKATIMKYSIILNRIKTTTPKDDD